MSAKQNQIVITHLGEPCVFEIKRSKLTLTDDGLDLDVFTHPNRECPLGHLSAPTIHIEGATVRAERVEELVEEELSVVVGWDTDEETKENNIFRIYVNQHEALNNNRVTISRNQSNQIEIRWTATAQDFLDFRNPDCTVEVYCLIEQRNIAND